MAASGSWTRSWGKTTVGFFTCRHTSIVFLRDALIGLSLFPPYSSQDTVFPKMPDAQAGALGREWGHIRLVTSCKLGQMQKTTGRYLNVILLCHPESSGSTHGSQVACQWMWFAMIKTTQYIFPHLVSTISSVIHSLFCDIYTQNKHQSNSLHEPRLQPCTHEHVRLWDLQCIFRLSLFITQIDESG